MINNASNGTPTLAPFLPDLGSEYENLCVLKSRTVPPFYLAMACTSDYWRVGFKDGPLSYANGHEPITRLMMHLARPACTRGDVSVLDIGVLI